MRNSILIVDDSSSIRKTLSSFLKNNIENEVFLAASKKECAEILLKQKGKFDVVLADLGLPDAPNGEVVDFLSKFSIPIIVLTGTDNELIEKTFIDKHIVDYIIKDGITALNYATSMVNRIINNKDIKILVVDDSSTFIAKVTELLNRYRLKVLSAKDGLEAFEILKNNDNIKIVLTDYLMPKLNGLELTKEIRKNYSKDELSIIVTSADSNKRMPSKFLKYGANDFLYKSFTNEEFFTRINTNIELLELFAEIKNKANKDHLTGLYNRRYLFDYGKKIYEKFKEENGNFAVAILDIDKFKNINDTYGHDVGDIAIKEVARILNDNISSNALITRLGGEEFCILFYDRGKEEVDKLLNHIRKEFEENIIKIKDIELKYTVSIGCSFNFGDNIDSIIQEADMSLYDAKQSGRNKVRYK